MKRTKLIFILLFICTFIYAQEDPEALSVIGTLVEYSEQNIENFETASGWTALETGNQPDIMVKTELRPGAPYYLETDGPAESVLGVKFTFSDVNTFMVHIKPNAPIALQEEPMTLSYWLHGENSNHQHSIVITDKDGKEIRVIYAGKMNWSGWKEVTNPIILPDAEPGELYFNGFYIHLDPLEISEFPFYLYIDAITVMNRRFME